MIVTFYSFKGGVGRSMAVANVADILARQGLRVLMIDFDLEAPGLEQYFQITHRAVLRQHGLLDLLLAYKRSMSVAGGSAGSEPEFKQLGRYIGAVYPSLGGTGCLDLLAAGQRETREQLDRYASNLRTFDWQDFYFNWEGELFFEWLRSALVPVRRDASGAASGYDLVIVDSRTGVTEMGGICTYQLADAVVMLSAANHQNRQGTINVAADFLSPPVQVARRDRPLEILAVPARVEQQDPVLFEQFLKQFEQQFAAFLPERLKRAGLGFRDLLIPYEPVYAFEERVISDPTRAAARGRIAGAFERIADAVRLLMTPDAVASAPTRDTLPRADGAPAAPLQYDAAKRFAGYDVFISYAAADAADAEALVEAVKAFGADVFIDRRELVAGEDWRARTEQAIFHSRVCLVCYGAARPDADVLGALAGVVASRDIRAVPVLLPGASPEAVQRGPLGHLQWLDLRAGVEADDARAALREIVWPLQADEPTAGSADHEAPASAASVVTFGAPYPGARAFCEADAGFLCGRDDTIRAAVGAIQQHPVVVVAGPSACGKTSLVEAGVVPALRAAAPSVGWGYVRVVAGDGPDDALERASQQLASMGCGQALLFVDQLERLLRDMSDDAQRQFLARLAAIVAQRPEGTYVVVAVRDIRLAELRELAPPGLLDQVVAVPPMTEKALRSAIERPAERAGLAFEPGLVDRIVADWGQDQRFLPCMQAVLHQLWSHRREGFLTNRAYDDVPDPVEAMAEAAYASLPALQGAMARVVPRLLALCGNLVPLDLSCQPDEVMLADIDPADVRRVLWHMVDARLVYAWAGAGGEGRLAPAFARQQWARADAWHERDAEFLDWLTSLHRHRIDWVRRHHDTGALLSGGVLTEARQQLAARAHDLTALETAFIERSHQLGLETAARSRRSKAIIGSLAAVGLLAFGLQAYYRRAELVEARQVAQSQQATAEARAQAVAVLVEAGDRAAASGDLAGAARSYDAALVENPDDQTALMRRGTLLDQQGNFASAIDDFTRVVTATAAPQTDAGMKLVASALHARALAYLHDNRLDQALADLDEAARRSPDDPLVLASRGAVLERMGRDAPVGSAGRRQQLEGAIRSYDASLAIRDDPDVAFSRGVLREELGQVKAAVTDFTKVLQSKNASPQAQLAARVKLEGAGVTPPGLGPSFVRPRTRITLIVSDSDDDDVARRLTAALTDAGYGEQAVRRMTVPVAGAEIRYYFNQDQQVATEVRDLASRAIAASGRNVPVDVRLMTSAPGRSAGDVEVWLPSLSRASTALRRSYTKYE